MAGTKKRSTGRAAKHHPKKRNAGRQPSSIEALAEMAEVCKEEDLLFRLRVNQRRILALDKYYNFKLFDGEGDQAIKRAQEYMQAYSEIQEEMEEHRRELFCRDRVHNDIALITGFNTGDFRARMFPPGPAAPQKAPGLELPEDETQAAIKLHVTDFAKRLAKGEVSVENPKK